MGTTRTAGSRLLEADSGSVEGTDFHLVFSPERVLTGRVFADLRKYPKLRRRARLGRAPRRPSTFYEQVLDFDERPIFERGNGVWDLGSAEAAEMAKLAETTYRDVNIGLANQFAMFAGQAGIDVYPGHRGLNSQPYSHIHRPGIAVGGHCIPVYPRLYLSNDPDATVVRAAREANAAMPAYSVGLAKQAVTATSTGATVVVLGAAYRGGVKETAFSGVFPTGRGADGRGATVSVHDPLFTREELENLGFGAYQYGTPADIAFVATDHQEYVELSPKDIPCLKIFLDGRNVLQNHQFDGAERIVVGTGLVSRTPR